MSSWNRGRTFWTTVLLTLFSVILTACGGTGGSTAGGSTKGTQASPDTAPILVGFSAPLTGGSAKGGEDMLRGAQLAVEQVNAKGGISGKTLQLLSEDDACDPQTAVAAANKLVSKGVKAVFGYYCSGAALAADPVYNNAGIPVILSAASATKLTEQGYDNLFRVQGNNAQQAQVAARLMAEDIKATKVVLLHDNGSYSKELAERTADELKKGYPSVAVQMEAITPGEKDFTAVLTKVKAFGPQAIYHCGYYPEGVLLVKQARQLRIGATFLAGDANNDPTFIEGAGKDGEGVIMTSPPMAEFVPTSAQFIKDYKAKFNIEPAAYAVYAYDSVNLLADAMQRAGSSDPQAVIKALRETKDFPAITNQISFDAKGDLARPGYIAIVIEDGKFAPYKK